MSVDVPAVPSVSVVIPVFNRAGSIRMAVESVLRQTFTDFELLVVDDGSTDGTLEILRGLADPRLRILTSPRNLGAGGARNMGIEAARGTWVAFHDSDDEWLPQKLEKQMARLAAARPETGPEVVACYCGMAVVAGPGWITGQDLQRVAGERCHVHYLPWPTHQKVEGDVLPVLLHVSLVSTQMLVARRETLVRIGGFDATLPALEDWECTLRLAECGPFAFVDEPLVLQYFSDNSITRSRQKRVAARAQIIAKHHALFSAHPAALAHHHVSIAGELRRLGDRAGARAELGHALRQRPFDPRLLAKWLWLTLWPVS